MCLLNSNCGPRRYAPPPQQYFTMTLFKRSMDKPDKTTRLIRREFATSRMGRYADGGGGGVGGVPYARHKPCVVLS